MKNVISIQYLLIIVSVSFALLLPQISQAKTTSSPPLPASENSGAPFITEWAVNANDTITIPLQSGTYNFNYKWTLQNDTSVFVIIDGTHTNADGDFTTLFAFGGTYQLEIEGEFPHLKGYPVDKLLDVLQWGDIVWGSMANTFQNWPGTSFSATDAPNLSMVTNMQSTFQGATNFNDDLDDWDVSNVTSPRFLFRDAKQFNGDISTWNVSNMTRMDGMFRGASNFNSNISTWIVTNVTRMDNMFFGASSFNQNIGDWDVSNVTNMIDMFRSADSFNQDIGDWIVAKVTRMDKMFERADNFNQPIGAWDVSKVTSMRFMFNRAAIFNQDIGTWDVGNVTDMQSMFQTATSFNQDISEWDVSSVTNMRQMFDNADSFNQPIGKWNVSNNLSFREMFRQNDAFNQSLGGWIFNPAANFLAVLNGATAFDCQVWSSTILGWNFSNPELENIPIGGPNAQYDIIADRARDELLERGWSISGTFFDGDCGAIHEFTCKDTVLVQNDTLFGNVIIRAAQLIILDNIVIDTSGIIFQHSFFAFAGESIIFKPGFHAVAGSNFTALIRPTPCGNAPNLLDEPVQSRSEEEQEEKREEELIISTPKVNDLSIQLAPNPTSGHLRLTFDSQLSGQAMLQIINLNGQLVYRSQLNLSEGTTIDELDVAHLPTGSYFILVRSGKEVVQAKFLKI